MADNRKEQERSELYRTIAKRNEKIVKVTNSNKMTQKNMDTIIAARVQILRDDINRIITEIEVDA